MSDNSTKASNDPLDASASPEERLLFAIFKNDPDKCINALKACWCNRASRAAEADMKKMEAYAEADATEIEKIKAKAEKPEPEESKTDTSNDNKADKIAQEAQTALEQFFDELIRDVVDKALEDDKSEDSKDDSDEPKDSDDSDESKASDKSEESDDDDFDEEDRSFTNENILEDNGVTDDFDVSTGVRNMHIPRDIYDVIKKRYDDGERCFFKLLAGTNAPIDILVQFKDVHLPKCEYYVPIYADKTYYLRVKTYSRTTAYIYTAKNFDAIKKLVKAYKDYDGSREPAMDDDTDTILSKNGYERSKKYVDSVLIPAVMSVNKPPKILDVDLD